MVYTERAPKLQQFQVAPTKQLHVHHMYTTSLNIQRRSVKGYTESLLQNNIPRIRQERSEYASEQRIDLHKGDQLTD